MRLTKLQEIQKITKQNQRHQFNRTWKTKLILLGSSVGLGAVLWALPVAAATTPTVTPQSTTSSVTTSTAASTATSAAPVASSTTSTTASSAGSVAPNTSTSTTTATTATTSGGTQTSAATSTATSSTSTSTGITFVIPSLAVSAPSSAFGSTASNASSATAGTTSTTVTTTATTGVTSSATSQASTSTSTATSATTSQASISTSAVTSAATSTASQVSPSVSAANSAAASLAALPDSTVITFADPGIEADILNDMKIYGPITLGNIRNYTGTTLNIGTTNVPLEITTSLEGMQYLQALPKTTLINLYSSFPSADFDLTPLENDRFSSLSIANFDLGAMNLAPLLAIDPTTISTLQLVGSIQGGLVDYQNNPNGMTNAQLVQIAPWLTAIDNTSNGIPGVGVDMNLSDNSLTDFSSLSGFTKSILFTALGQRVNYDTTPVNFVIGQPGSFTPLPLTGMNGESLTSHYQVTLSGSPTQAYPATTHPLEPAITNLGNGQFEIPTAYPTYPNANWFAYGLSGYYDLTTAAQMDTNFIEINYPNGTTFEYDVMVYQPANWLTAPELTVKYVDATTGAEIQPATSMNGTTIGETYNLTPQTKIPGYAFDALQSSSPTGTYTQNPQALTFTFAQEPAGGITVNYLDESGHAIAPSTTINGYVGTPYSSQPVTVAGYTYLQAAALPTTVPTSGTLATTPGTIDYIYAANTLTRTIQYYDVTTDKALSQAQISGLYNSTTNYSPATSIANYEAQGYELVANNYPTGGSLFDDPTTSATYVIEFAHKMEALTPATPDLPTGVTLQNQVNRTIEYVNNDGETVAAPTLQTITFTRNAVRDMVTGDVTYGPWIATDSDNFNEVTPPMLSSLETNQTEVPAEAAIAETKPDEVVEVVYSPVATSGATSTATSAATSGATSTATNATTSTATSAATSATTSTTASTATSSATSATSTATSTSSIGTMSGTPISAGSQANLTPMSEVAQPVTPAMTRQSSERQATTEPLVTTKAAPARTTAKLGRAVTPLKKTTTTGTTPENKTVKKVKPAQSLASGLPQTSEQSNETSVIGLILVALGGFLASLKRLFRRES